MDNSKRFNVGVKRFGSVAILFVMLFSLSLFLSGQGAVWRPHYRNWQENRAMWGIANNGTKYVGVGDSGYNWYSVDGFNWTQGSNFATPSYVAEYAGNKFVVGGSAGIIRNNSTGNAGAWSQPTSNITAVIKDIHYEASLNWVMAVGTEGWIALSKDGGSTYQQVKIAGASTLQGVTYGNGTWVICGANGYVFTSADGTNWSGKKVSIDHLYTAVYGTPSNSPMFVVAGYQGRIYSSPDGVTWTQRSGADNKTFLFRGVWTGTVFTLIGEYSNTGPYVAPVWTSPNGTAWTFRNSNAYNALLGLTYNASKSRLHSSGSWMTIVYSDNAAESINITAPASASYNSQLTLTPGSTYTVRWTYTGNPGNLKLDYSKTGGMGSFTNVASDINPADGSYSWTVPNDSSSNCILRLAKMDGTHANHTLPFTVGAGGGGNGTLTITAPNGGEVITPGSKYTIRWSSTGIVSSVRLRYSTNGGSTWVKFADNVSNTGSYSWTVPNVNSSNCLIRINEVNSSGTPNDTSNATFTIGEGGGEKSITVVSPNGGNSLTPGSTYTVRWNSTGGVGNVRLRYSTNGGSSWVKFADNVANSGSYSWTVPNVNSANCLVRINEVNSSGEPYDESDRVFTIGDAASGTITVTSPNGGEAWQASSLHDITWTSTGTVGSVDISYSTNNGSSWTAIASGDSNDGVRAWRVPSTGSSQYLVKVASSQYANITDTSDATFNVSTGTLTLTSPNGGEQLSAGSLHIITWTSTGSVGNVKLEYTLNSGSTWSTISASTSNDGKYGWTLPNASATSCKVRVSEANGGSSDTSNGTFSISSGTLTLTSPNGGESYLGGSSENITWTSTGNIGNVKLEYSTNNGTSWTVITNNTSNDGLYGWTLPDIVSSTCLVRVGEAAGGATDTSNAVFSIGGSKVLSLSRTNMVFGYAVGGKVPSPQSVIVSNSGAGSLNWTATPDVGWISATPGSGSGDALVSITVDPTGLGQGSYSGTVSFNDNDADNSPLSLTVSLNVSPASRSEVPIGTMEQPTDGSTVSSSIAVSGWALDDTGVENVKIYADGAYIGEAVFVDGARPDLETAYPDYPQNYRAGWGYMLLTNFLPNGGNGNYVISAVATDTDGNAVTLGSVTVTVDNHSAVKPFGAIDTPAQGGVASGSNYINWGWALTPLPNTIPTDGSTILVWIDAMPVGNPVYNNYRSDIASLFPGRNNSGGAAGYFYFDTTAYANGVHQIAWSVRDDAGNGDGIGSRFFSIQNFDGSRMGADSTPAPLRSDVVISRHNMAKIAEMPGLHAHDMDVKQGSHRDARFVKMGEVVKQQSVLEVKIMERVEVKLTPNAHFEVIDAFTLVGDELRALPVGSTLDKANGIFAWIPSAAHRGPYNYIVILRNGGGQEYRRYFQINVIAAE